MTEAQQTWAWSAARIARAVRARQVSAEDVARDALRRLDAVNPALNAVVEHRPEEVIARAREVDAAIARGEDPGVLAGVPVTIKVNVDQAGFPTTNGLRIQAGQVAATNSPVVDNLLRAGAVPLGRTNAPAFSCRWFTDNLLHGATRNPHDPSLTPGGSSGGAASAVAAGIGAIAHGTDIAGSIRYPAYACGVQGLRPSLGRVAAWNASAPERTIGGQLMAVSGPLARSVEDLRLALAVLSARDPRDPWWTPAPPAGPDLPRRVAMCPHPEGLATAPEVVEAMHDAARRLRDAGWTVEETDTLPPLREAADIVMRLWWADGFDGLRQAAEREGDPGALAAIRANRGWAASTTLADFAAALSRRQGILRQWQLFLERYPLVMLPPSGSLPFRDGLDLEGEAGMAEVLEAQMPMIALPALGLPAINVRTGFAGRAPVGVQLMAGRFREDLCLAAGEAIEARGAPILPVDPRPAA